MFIRYDKHGMHREIRTSFKFQNPTKRKRERRRKRERGTGERGGGKAKGNIVNGPAPRRNNNELMTPGKKFNIAAIIVQMGKRKFPFVFTIKTILGKVHSHTIFIIIYCQRHIVYALICIETSAV